MFGLFIAGIKFTCAQLSSAFVRKRVAKKDKCTQMGITHRDFCRGALKRLRDYMPNKIRDDGTCISQKYSNFSQ